MLKYNPPIISLKEALLIISNKFRQLFNHSSYKIAKVQMSLYRKNKTQLINKNRINF